MAVARLIMYKHTVVFDTLYFYKYLKLRKTAE